MDIVAWHERRVRSPDEIVAMFPMILKEAEMSLAVG